MNDIKEAKGNVLIFKCMPLSESAYTSVFFMEKNNTSLVFKWVSPLRSISITSVKGYISPFVFLSASFFPGVSHSVIVLCIYLFAKHDITSPFSFKLQNPVIIPEKVPLLTLFKRSTDSTRTLVVTQ